MLINFWFGRGHGLNYGLGVVYLILLLWCFMGVAIIADVFMGAIEVITSKQKKVIVDGKTFHVRMWNDTVANLTLMALGSSAPEILLSVIELFDLKLYSGPLGPSTIVGSAAFNLLVITAVCIVSIPNGEVRRIKELPVFFVTASFSIFAYLWIFIILTVATPNVVTVVEAVITFVMFFALVGLAYAVDRGLCKSSVKVNPDGGIVRAVQENGVNAGDVRSILKQIRKTKPHLTEGDVQKLAMFQSTQEDPPHRSRAYYRIQATRNLTGGAKIKDDTKEPPVLLSDLLKEDYKPACKKQFIAFEQSAMGCNESDQIVKVKVIRSDTAGKVEVPWRTAGGTAEAGKDFTSDCGVLVYADGEKEKTIQVHIVNDDENDEMDEHFSVMLGDLDAKYRESYHLVDDLRELTVTIRGDRRAGILCWKNHELPVCESEGKVELIVDRLDGFSGKITVDYYTRNETAIAGADYEETKGTLTFEHGEMKKTIIVPIIDDDAYEKDETFQVVLENPTGGAKFSAKSNGGQDSDIALITIISDEKEKKLVDSVMGSLNINRDRIKIGTSNWKSQFMAAIKVNGGDTSMPVSKVSLIVHFITMPWKVLFSVVPPTDFANGWVCFGVALILIGFVTAIIGDLANHLGCSVGMSLKVTAITFVALGTSLPDLFASMSSAVMDKHADNSIGNVTGSNSVNVFLGLGMPWVIAALYWSTRECPQEWIDKNQNIEGAKAYIGTSQCAYIVDATGLGSSVMIFTFCAITCLSLLMFRRKFCGGEFGGPKVAGQITAAICVTLWILYISLSWAEVEIV